MSQRFWVVVMVRLMVNLMANLMVMVMVMVKEKVVMLLSVFCECYFHFNKKIERK